LGKQFVRGKLVKDKYPIIYDNSNQKGVKGTKVGQ